jgi:ADP-heptose:LPS heptosyltransferase
LATCDACIAPDSVFCHVAGALHIPTIALYGPFPWQLRTAHAPSIHALQGVAKCAPCFHHSRVGEVFPRGEECENTGDCAALARISPSRIVSKIDSLIGGVK